MTAEVVSFPSTPTDADEAAEYKRRALAMVDDVKKLIETDQLSFFILLGQGPALEAHIQWAGIFNHIAAQGLLHMTLNAVVQDMVEQHRGL